ncbi:MAG: sulfite reductase subunit A, partial [Actinomycetota bacterium]
MDEPGAGDRVLDLDALETLLHTLRESYRVIGPTIRDGAIVYDDVASLADLPRGWTDEQDGGTYRLRRRDDDALFGYAVGPHSWKQFLFPPHTLLTRIRRTDDGGLEMSDGGTEEEAPRLAFLAARACDLHAIAVQDRVFLQRGAQDPTYATRRENAFIVAVNCGEPAGTCFCVSMGTGPRAEGGFDVALTEVLDGGGHRFLAEAGTEKGAEVLAGLPSRAALPADAEAADAVVASAASRMGRQLDTEGIKDLLYRNYEHPRWDEVASRCLSCTNCTMVCPTCFCS